MPVVFILLLPVAFAASVKKDDHADNAFSFAYDAEADSMVNATSSTRHTLDDDVSLFVNVAESAGGSPLVGKSRFELSSKKAVRYDGTLTFTVDDAGTTAFESTRHVAFTLRPKPGKRVRSFTFPFDVPTGYYDVTVTFSR